MSKPLEQQSQKEAAIDTTDSHHQDRQKQPPPFKQHRRKSANPRQLATMANFVSLLAVSTVALLALLASGQPQFPWMARLASLTAGGQAPKISGPPPLIQFDTSSKYYKVMIDSMLVNFKKTINKVADSTSFSLKNATNVDIALATGSKLKSKLSVKAVDIDGLDSFKVSNIHLTGHDLRLHVNFNYRLIRLNGQCSDETTQPPTTTSTMPLLEASNWNASWSADILAMIGRSSLDMRKVGLRHQQQKLNLNTKGQPLQCFGVEPAALKSALVERIGTVINGHLNEVMDIVMMKSELFYDDNNQFVFSKADAMSMANSNEKLAKKQKAKQTKDKPLRRRKRQTPCQPGDDLDDYVDQLFKFGSRIVRAMEPVPGPNVTIELPDYNLKVFLYEGKITRAYNFKRSKPAWVFCSNATTSLGITVEVDQVRVGYKYRVISGHRLIFDGDLEAKLSPKAQAQFSQANREEDSEDPVQQRVDRIRVFRLGKVHVVIRGLGNLTQSLSMLINSYLNDNQEELQPTFRMVEGDALKMVNKMLSTVSVPLLSVV